MNRNLHSPTKLTEFARDFDAEPETFLTKFVNKITNAYNSGYNTVNVVPQQNVVNISGSSSNTPPHVSRSNSDNCVLSTVESANQSIITEVNEVVIGEQKSTSPTPTTSDSISIEDSAEKVIFIDKNVVVILLHEQFQPDEFPLDVPQERTPSSVLHRISNLMALKNNVRFVFVII